MAITPIVLTLTNADIVGRLNSLADVIDRATSGTTSTIVKIIDGAVDNEFNNHYACFLSGVNKGEDRIITTFLASSGLFVFEAPVLPTAVDNKSEFAIVEVGFLGKMDEAFDIIKEDTRNSGYNIDLFLTTAQLKEIHLYKTLDLICLDLYRDASDEDMYWSNHLVYDEKYEKTFNTLKADYDRDEDGLISEQEEDKNFGFGIIRKTGRSNIR